VRAGKDAVLFHPVSEQNPLIDFIFKVGKVFYAVQVTTAKTHDAEEAKIEKLVRDLKLRKGEKLKLLYAVPLDHFETFDTKPVEPSTPACPVTVIGIPNPSASTVAGSGPALFEQDKSTAGAKLQDQATAALAKLNAKSGDVTKLQKKEICAISFRFFGTILKEAATKSNLVTALQGLVAAQPDVLAAATALPPGTPTPTPRITGAEGGESAEEEGDCSDGGEGE